jgi:hypothetical protein
MPVIYVDNYRGFQETFIPLKSINFLVGENSTGKTSILKLIRALTDFKFWFIVDFNNEETELGYFSEIASYSNPRRKDFVIGILGEEEDKENAISAIKMKFISSEGIPTISEINFIDQGLNVQAIILENEMKFRHEKISLDKINKKNKLKYFKYWINNNGLKNKTYTTISLKDGMPINAFYYVQLQIYQQLKIQKSPNIIEMPMFIRDLTWLAPIRTEPRRTYDRYNTKFQPDGTHSPYLLKKLLTDTKHKSYNKKIETILSKFGFDSGLFDKISINPLGTSDTAPFEILVYLEEIPIKITSVGYGVSQILPLIVEIIYRPAGTWFAIQQPEIHLHPKAQAAFGDLIYKSHQLEKKCFIIETHSDFIIDRFRLRVNKDSNLDEPIDSQVLFFNRTAGINQVSCIQINKDGSYCDEQPKEFREFFIKEQLNLLSI